MSLNDRSEVRGPFRCSIEAVKTTYTFGAKKMGEVLVSN